MTLLGTPAAVKRKSSLLNDSEDEEEEGSLLAFVAALDRAKDVLRRSLQAIPHSWLAACTCHGSW